MLSADSKDNEALLGPISGYTNYSVKEHQAFHKALQTIEDVYIKHGFSAFYPRPVERLQNLLLKGGIGKQIFSMALRDGTPVETALPFDRTLSLALFVADNLQALTYPFKRFDISYSFRGEHAQAGRFRGFFQADIDIIGPDLLIEADVECISTIYDSLKELKIGDFRINVNHIQLARSIIKSYDVKEEQIPDVLRIIDKMDKIKQDEIEKELTALLKDINPKKVKEMVSLYAYEGGLENFESLLDKMNAKLKTDCSSATQELKALMQQLQASGAGLNQINFSPRMVRGLDYYTGIVFETFLIGKERYGSIASGGRYSNLVSAFQKSQTNIEGTGGSIGLTRLFDIAVRENLIPLERETLADILIAMRTEEFAVQANQIAYELRKNGHKVDLYVGPKKIKKELNYANKKQIPFVIMVMDKESFVVRNMQDSSQTEFKTAEEAILHLEKLL